MALQHPLEAVRFIAYPHFDASELDVWPTNHTAVDTQFTKGYKVTQRDTATDIYNEASSYKDPLCYTILPRYTQQYPEPLTHGHTHTLTTFTNIRYDSEPRIQPFLRNTNHSVTPYSHTPTPARKICSHRSHTMVTHTYTLINYETTWPHQPSPHWSFCKTFGISTSFSASPTQWFLPISQADTELRVCQLAPHPM